MGHSIPWSGHLGKEKIVNRKTNNFYWPGLLRVMLEFCKSCPECQLSSHSSRGLKAPLISPPMLDVPFSRIAIDFVGTFERSTTDHRYILVICDYAICYPEAFFRHTKARQIANCLLPSGNPKINFNRSRNQVY